MNNSGPLVGILYFLFSLFIVIQGVSGLTSKRNVELGGNRFGIFMQFLTSKKKGDSLSESQSKLIHQLSVGLGLLGVLIGLGMIV